MAVKDHFIESLLCIETKSENDRDNTRALQTWVNSVVIGNVGYDALVGDLMQLRILIVLVTDIIHIQNVF